MIQKSVVDRRSNRSERRPLPPSMIARKSIGPESSGANALRQRVGNQGIQKLMGDTLRSLPTQAKLTVSVPGDAHEREADRVADTVMRMRVAQVPDTSTVASTASTAQVQRMCANCEEEQKHDAIPQLRGTRAGGSSLDREARSFMEPRFGRSFADVRIHTGAHAARSAEAIGAAAYTIGRDIVFGVDRYAPHSSEGRKLIAHELTHVVQQGAAPRVARSGKGRDLTIGEGSGAKASITPASPGIQRRNGGLRPPPRRPPGRVPSRGREGQREGQRLPRTPPSWRQTARREAFERRERERIEAALQRFNEMVARNQRWLENWAKEGSEPKTPAERAFRVLVKMLEAWDEVSSSWSKAHSELEATLRLRHDPDVMRSGPSSVAFFDRQLIATQRELSRFDVEMLLRLTEWQQRMDKWIEWRDRVYPTITNVINLSFDLVGLVLDALMIASELRKQLSPIERDIHGVHMQLLMRYRLQAQGQRVTPTIREAD